jgi:transmembrane sensor
MTNNKNIEEQEKALFSQLKPNYSKNKEDVWSTLEKTVVQNQTVQKKKTRTIRLVWIKYAAAASILIVIGLGLFARLYATTIDVPTGQTSQHTLPDGSIIYLNSESSINYHPYWWSFNREVELDGEAFFEVEKGESFRVLSEMGSVEVLGTSFNVYCRSDKYAVYCKTGKVRVRDPHSNEVILTPEQFVSANAETNTLQLKDNVNTDQVMSWRLNKFLYNTTPITKVLEDFERHYGIRINTDIDNIDELHYTGLFMRDIGAQKALDIISFSFELNVEKNGENTYLVKY